MNILIVVGHRQCSKRYNHGVAVLNAAHFQAPCKLNCIEVKDYSYDYKSAIQAPKRFILWLFIFICHTNTKKV